MFSFSKVINFEKIKSIKKFINHNKKIFPKKKLLKKNKSEVLIEFNAFYPTHLSMSYLSNVLAKKNDSKITAFFNYSIISSPLNPTLMNRIKWTIGNLFSLATFKIYRSFGVSKIFRPMVSKIQKKKCRSKL